MNQTNERQEVQQKIRPEFRQADRGRSLFGGVPGGEYLGRCSTWEHSVWQMEANQTPLRKIAIFWAATGVWRHIPFSFFERLADFPGAQFFSFQQGPCEREAQDSVLPMRRLSKHTVDICDLASALTKMDLVLTVDTMAAHLAGSLRIPVWLLLEGAADWRLIEGRTNSPWYPEMRIFREQHGWEEIDKLLQEIPRGRIWKLRIFFPKVQ